MDYDQLDRLEGLSGSEKGGLIIKKKKNPSSDQDEFLFKKPQTSLLGLDRLAAKRRELEKSKLKLNEDKQTKE